MNYIPAFAELKRTAYIPRYSLGYCLVIPEFFYSIKHRGKQFHLHKKSVTHTIRIFPVFKIIRADYIRMCQTAHIIIFLRKGIKFRSDPGFYAYFIITFRLHFMNSFGIRRNIHYFDRCFFNFAKSVTFDLIYCPESAFSKNTYYFPAWKNC